MTNLFSRATKNIIAISFLAFGFSNLALANTYLTAENDCTKQNHVYVTANDAMEYFSDFYPENNSLEIISESPLKIRLSSSAYEQDDQHIKQLIAKRAVVYGVYRSLINTPNDSVTVTSYLISDKKKLDNSPEYTVTITKPQLLEITKKYIPINELSDVINASCSFTDQFNQLRYDDSSKKGFNKFFDELLKANK